MKASGEGPASSRSAAASNEAAAGAFRRRTSTTFAMITLAAAEGADVSATGILRGGSFSSAKPGGTADPSCTAATVMDGFEEWKIAQPRN